MKKNENWIVTASGDAIQIKYIKRLYIWTDGFGVNKKFIVKAIVDGGAKADDWIIIDVFSKFEDAAESVKKITGGD